MQTFRDLIARWPTVAEFGRDIGVEYQAARKMHERDSIRDVHWTAVVAAARQRGIRVTVEALASMKARRGNDGRNGGRAAA